MAFLSEKKHFFVCKEVRCRSLFVYPFGRQGGLLLVQHPPLPFGLCLFFGGVCWDVISALGPCVCLNCNCTPHRTPPLGLSSSWKLKV